MAIRRSRIILLGLLVLLIASLWRTVALERDKRRIATIYEEAKHSLAQLEEERDQLTTELTSARGTIDDQTGKLTSLQEELQGVQQRLDQTVTEFASLQREHEQLRQQNTSVMAEKQQLEAKLSSIHELKLAIRDLRYKMWQQRFAAMREWFQRPRTTDRVLASGNRGYIVRDGLSTLGTTTRLHVRVLEPEPQPR